MKRKIKNIRFFGIGCDWGTEELSFDVSIKENGNLMLETDMYFNYDDENDLEQYIELYITFEYSRKEGVKVTEFNYYYDKQREVFQTIMSNPKLKSRVEKIAIREFKKYVDEKALKKMQLKKLFEREEDDDEEY